jgi:hypothetical protein
VTDRYSKAAQTLGFKSCAEFDRARWIGVYSACFALLIKEHGERGPGIPVTADLLELYLDTAVALANKENETF